METKQYAPTIELLKCTKLLTRKTTDDEKVAGLMVLPYVLAKESEKEAYEYVFRRIDWVFVKRLLVSGVRNFSGNTGNDTNKDNDLEDKEKGAQYIQLALYILATFLCNGFEDKLVKFLPLVSKVAALGIAEFSELVIQDLCCLLMSKFQRKVLVTAEEWVGNVINSLNLGLDQESRLFDTLCGVLVHSSKESFNSLSKSQDMLYKGDEIKECKKNHFLILSELSKYISGISLENKLLCIEKVSNTISNLDANFYYDLTPALATELESSINRLVGVYSPILQQKHQSVEGRKYRLSCVQLATGVINKWDKLVFKCISAEKSETLPINQYFVLCTKISILETSLIFDSYSKSIESQFVDQGLSVYCELINTIILHSTTALSSSLSDKNQKTQIIHNADGSTSSSKESFHLDPSKLKELLFSVLKQISEFADDLSDFIIRFSKSKNLFELLSADVSFFEAIQLFINIFTLSVSLKLPLGKVTQIMSLFVGIYSELLHDSKAKINREYYFAIHTFVDSLNDYSDSNSVESNSINSKLKQLPTYKKLLEMEDKLDNIQL